MPEQNDSYDFPAFDIFLKFFKLNFGFSPEIKTWKFNPEKISQKQLVLFFSWPGIIANKLLFPNDKKEIDMNLYELIELLKSPPEFENLFKKIIELNKLSKDEKYLEQCEEFFEDYIEKHPNFQGLSNNLITNIAESFNDLLESKNKSESNLSKLIDNISFDNPKRKNKAPISLSKFTIKIFFLYSMSEFIGNDSFRKIFLGIFYYYLIFFLFLESLEDKSEDPLINIQNIFGYLTGFHETYGDDFETLVPIFNNCIAPALSGLFGEAFTFLRNEDEKLFLNFEGVPLTDDKVHCFNNENPNYYACILPDRYNSDTDNTYYDIDIIREIQPIKGIDYKLRISFFEELFYGDFDGVCEFIGEDIGGKTVSEQLLFFLYHMAKRITVHISNFIESWEDFIDNPAMIVDQNLDKFAKKWKPLLIHTVYLMNS